jgi:hypothetical protein
MFFVSRFQNLPISRSGDRAPRCIYNQDIEVLSLEGRSLCVCQSVNLSRSGILLQSPRLGRFPALAVGTEVLVRLAVDHEHVVEPFEVVAKIIRLQTEQNPPVITHIALMFVRYNKTV